MPGEVLKAGKIRATVQAPGDQGTEREGGGFNSLSASAAGSQQQQMEEGPPVGVFGEKVNTVELMYVCTREMKQKIKVLESSTTFLLSTIA